MAGTRPAYEVVVATVFWRDAFYTSGPEDDTFDAEGGAPTISSGVVHQESKKGLTLCLVRQVRDRYSKDLLFIPRGNIISIEYERKMFDARGKRIQKARRRKRK